MESEWSLKPWRLVDNKIAIYHATSFCTENLTLGYSNYTWGCADKKVCFHCEKPIPQHILLQWKLGGYGIGSDK